jgi:hypothetical protein
MHIARIALLAAATLGLIIGGCGGGGDATSDSGLSVNGELAKSNYDEIKAEVDKGNGADQNLACAFLMGMIEEGAASEADKQLLADSRSLCFGEVHKAMFDKTVADVEARGEDETLPPFMECVPAQTAMDEATNEVDVPGLADSKAKAQELCAKAWEE